MGTLIAIDGIDASGKTTQALLLYDELVKMGKNVKYLSFPDYENQSSVLVKMYLDGKFGNNSNSVNPYAASSFYAVDRFSSYMTSWKDFYEREDTIVIANRYTTANAIHQIAKLKREEWNYFLDWLYDFEFEKLSIPKPNLVVFFDMHIEVSLRLIESRCEENNTKKDIHENDKEHLIKSYEAAKYAANYLKWETLYCYEEKKERDKILEPKSREKILEELKNLIFQKLDI